MRYRDIKTYITEDFWAALTVYHMTENLGCLPFTGGWAEQPIWITQALACLKVEASLIEHEQWERDHPPK